MRSLAIAATLAALAFAGCGEHYTPVSKHQVLVQDNDGAADLNNVAHACHGVQNVKGVVWTHAPRRVALVTCR